MEIAEIEAHERMRRIEVAELHEKSLARRYVDHWMREPAKDHSHMVVHILEVLAH